MGMFSYICSKSNEAISSDEKHVVLYFLKNGVVQEVMAGKYNAYGAVNGEDQVVHKLLTDGELRDVPPANDPSFGGDEWYYGEWDELVNAHFDQDNGNGFHAVIGDYDAVYTPTEISDDDPNQGWGADDDCCEECGCENCDCDDDEY